MDIASRRWERRCRMVARRVPQSARRRHACWPESVKSCRPREGGKAHSVHTLHGLFKRTDRLVRNRIQKALQGGPLRLVL